MVGYLWLHQGNWNGQQIVPQTLVLDSVRRHSIKVDHDSGYGYGWWINMSHYFAAGRGGQEIRVIPAFNTIMVTTGGSFEMPEIEGFLIPVLLQSSRPRPAKPAGQVALEATLANIQQNDAIPAGLSTPEIANLVSGRLYQCQNNVAGLESLHIDFYNPRMAELHQKNDSVKILFGRLDSTGAAARPQTGIRCSDIGKTRVPSAWKSSTSAHRSTR